MGKASGKKINRKLKRTIRRTVGTLCLVSAITVAAIPVPENFAYDLNTAAVPSYPEIAYDSSGNASRPNNGATGYLNIANSSVPNSDAVYSANNRAFVISKTSTGDYQLDWQFDYYAATAGANGYIVKYNDQYQVDEVELNYRVYSDYVNVPEAQEQLYFQSSGVTADIDIYYGDNKQSTKTVNTLGHEYRLTGDPTTAPDHDFFYNNLRSEYDAYKVQYDNYMLYKDDPMQAPSYPKPEDLVRTFKDVYTTDAAQMQYLCDQLFGTGTAMSLQIVDKRVYDSGNNPTGWSKVYVPRLSSTPAGDGKTVTIQGTSYYFDDNLFLANKFGAIIGVAKNAFKDVKNVRTLTMAREISSIGDSAFENSFLQSVTVSSDAKIGNRAFAECIRLTSATLPEGVGQIGAEAFTGCPLDTITIPDSVTEIGDGAFYNCQRLKEVKFQALGSADKTIGDGAFYNCLGLNSVDFSVTGDGSSSSITKMGDAAFAVSAQETGNMTEFQFPNTITTGANMGNYLLGGRVKLQNVILPTNLGVTSLADTFVYGCVNLESVTFPDSANQATYDPTTFYSVTNPDFHVRGPKVNTSGTAANSRKSTWKALFDYNASEAKGKHVPYVYNEGGVDYYEVSDGRYVMVINSQTGELTSCTFAEGVAGSDIGTTPEDPFTIPAKVGTTTVTGIKDGCFNGGELTGVLDYIVYLEIEDGSGITALNDGCFEGADKLQGVVIGDSVKTIGSRAFNNSPLLAKVQIGPSIEKLGDSAFAACPKLTEIYFEPPASTEIFTLEDIGANALTTGSPKLTVTGTIAPGYGPFAWSMRQDNFVDSVSGLRVCYKSPAPDNLTVILDNTNLLPTLVDYPHYEQLSAELRTKIENGTSLTVEEQYAYNCTTDIVLPEGIKSIDVYGFINNGSAGSATGLNNGVSTDTYLKNADYYKQYSKYGLFNGYYGLFAGDATSPSSSILGLDDYKEYQKDTSDSNVYESNAIGNDRITSVVMHDVTYLPDKAFESCERLGLVALGDDITDTGELPFFGCTNLTSVGCSNNNFAANNGILYQNNTDGSKKLIECFASRGGLVGTGTINTTNDPDLKDVNEIAKGAFSDCDNIRFLDFAGAASLSTIPEDCFRGSDNLRTIDLPATVSQVEDNAFAEIASDVEVIARNKQVYLSSTAFGNTSLSGQPYYVTYTNAASRQYAKKQGANTDKVLDDQYTFNFYTYDGLELIKTVFVNSGGTAEEPEASEIPIRQGYTFTGWNRSLKNITADGFALAVYTADANTTPGVTPGVTPGTTPGTTPGSTTPGAGAKTTPTPDAKKYTLTVVYGTGSGQYPEGTKVIIEAIDAPSGKVFDKWIVTGASATIYSSTSKSTTITTAAGDTAVTATYKDVTGTQTGGSTAGSSGTYTRTGTGTGESSTGTGNNGGYDTNNNGTKVSISKPGISDADKAYASVSGSTDSFVVKISESTDAANAVATALANKYGDMTPIKYFAMDISLYDSTGTNLITDTTGLSVNVTIPIPDALRQYAGNNKVGAVVNGNTLEDLNCKFVTVGGVPCVSFTATHFSPYTVYVDTSNLTYGTPDGSPKTGDPIHPKWFVVLALAATSLFLFLKKDRVAIPKTI